MFKSTFELNLEYVYSDKLAILQVNCNCPVFLLHWEECESAFKSAFFGDVMSKSELATPSW